MLKNETFLDDFQTLCSTILTHRRIIMDLIKRSSRRDAVSEPLSSVIIRSDMS